MNPEIRYMNRDGSGGAVEEISQAELRRLLKIKEIVRQGIVYELERETENTFNAIFVGEI